MQIIVYHSKARKTMCGMGTFCLIGMISLQLTIQNGERFTHETISAKILANANHVDIIVSKSLKKLITVMSTSGDGVYIRQASAINAKSVRVYTNSDSSERNTAFLVLYL